MPESIVNAPPGRRERNKQEKLQRIVAAARRLFDERGFDGATTQAIAEAADIGAGTLFLYAPSKEDLLIMVFRDDMIAASRSARMALDPAAPMLDQLMALFGAMIEHHARDVPLARVLIKELAMPASKQAQDNIAVLMREIYGGLAEVLRVGQQHGHIRAALDLRAAAEALFGVYYLGLITWLSGATPRPMFEIRLRKKLAVVLSGVTP